ncbi:hypothetical protein [Sphingomonas turrisvirgatae]|uniref:hypothetical protein n=1 Tax=Sphingomonas turrisvirgatae TaxID=1888892 RepID=UPI001041E61F|nr:hypothetical protein [Sphingomonas turrisvirgatae]
MPKALNEAGQRFFAATRCPCAVTLKQSMRSLDSSLGRQGDRYTIGAIDDHFAFFQPQRCWAR